MKAFGKFSKSAEMTTDTLDRLGATASSACAIHCMITPLVIGILPALGIGFLAAPWFENSAVLGAICLAVVSLMHGYLHHRRFHALWLLLIGAILLLSGRFVIGNSRQLIETPFVVLGGLALAGAHLINRRLCKACTRCEAHAHTS
jgi:membrane-bound ClpP family serine protease